jgi:hypothetical protein
MRLLIMKRLTPCLIIFLMLTGVSVATSEEASKTATSGSPIISELLSKDEFPAIIGLVGVLFGALLAPVTASLIKHFEEKRERRTLTLAFYGELSGLKALLQLRNLSQSLREIMAKIDRAQQPTRFFATASKPYFQVYDTCVPRIGLLKPPLNVQIPTFYTYGKTVLDGLEFMDRPEAFMSQSQTEQKQWIQTLIAIITQTEELLDKILAEIRSQYPHDIN